LSKVQDVRKSGHVSLIARAVVAVLAILWVLHGQDWAKLLAVLQRLSPWYFGLSLATFTGAQIVIVLRWWLLLRAQSIHVAISATTRLFFLGLFYNNVMPGAVGGDVLKAWYITKHTDKRLEGALSVFVDRVIGLVGLILMAAFTYLMFVQESVFGPRQAKETGPPAWISQHREVVLLLGVLAAAALASALAHPYSRAQFSRGVAALLRRGRGVLQGVKDALVVYCSKPLTVFWALVLTFISQSTVIISFWLLGRNLGIEAGLKYYFVVFPITWVIGAVPISIAGLGVVEAGTVGLFGVLTGTAPEKALALAFCQRFVWMLASLPGGLIHLVGAHLPRQISVDGREDPT
jgi:uncharacterized membrane protein YbhN (UPF0104 family)